jgi:N-acetyl-1-D-myo-inositol-2-amino-2-deoxy-alpha-D-glucopyranoside deacetylase
LILPVLSREHYVLVSGRPGGLDARGWENDLLAGIDLAAG